MHRARGSGAGEDDWGQQLAPVSDESDNGTGTRGGMPRGGC